MTDEPIPEFGAGPEGGLDSFLQTVREMVHDESAVAAPVATGAAGLDKVTKRHEEKLAKAERRNTRRHRRSRRDGKVIAVEAPAILDEPPLSVDVPAEPQRVPAQPAGPVIQQVWEAHVETAAAAAEMAAADREQRRGRHQEAARAAVAPLPDEEPWLEPVQASGPTMTVADPVRRTRRARRRERHREAALAVAASVPAAQPVLPEPVIQPPGGAGTPGPAETVATPSRRARRRELREQKVLARAVAKGPSGDGRGPDPETLAEHVARVEAPRLPRRTRRSRPRTPRWFRRTLKVAALAILISAAAVVPWAVPRLPTAISDMLPGHSSAVHIRDPKVAPATDAIVGPVGVDQQAGPYDGVRLQSAGRPREVQVNRLDVDSDVVAISGQSGTLLPPSDPQLLGWWQEGRVVGSQYGAAVITGHTVHTGGGALDHLDQLVVGDKIRVRTDAGWIKYVVKRTQVYSTAELAADAKNLFRAGGTGRLVLITCDDWNGQFYESNALVVATPLLDEPFVP